MKSIGQMVRSTMRAMAQWRLMGKSEVKIVVTSDVMNLFVGEGFERIQVMVKRMKSTLIDRLLEVGGPYHGVAVGHLRRLQRQRPLQKQECDLC
jgi:hypothetical protein